MQAQQEIKTKDLRGFGLIVGVILAGVFGLLLPYWKHRTIYEIPLYIGSALIVLAIVLPVVLKYPYILWMKIGAILGWINTRIILGAVFFVLFTPLALFFKLFGKDFLQRKLDSSLPSYRVPTAKREISHMERPF